jgi:hypothetical protein
MSVLAGTRPHSRLLYSRRSRSRSPPPRFPPGASGRTPTLRPLPAAPPRARGSHSTDEQGRAVPRPRSGRWAQRRRPATPACRAGLGFAGAIRPTPRGLRRRPRHRVPCTARTRAAARRRAGKIGGNVGGRCARRRRIGEPQPGAGADAFRQAPAARRTASRSTRRRPQSAGRQERAAATACASASAIRPGASAASPPVRHGAGCRRYSRAGRGAAARAGRRA